MAHLRFNFAMLWLYRFLFLPVLLALAPGYLLRMRRRGGLRQKFSERFGRHPDLGAKSESRRRIWIQAVSLGEVLAIVPLVESLLRHENLEIYVTTTTTTAYRVADQRFEGLVRGVGYFPIDWWWFSVLAWRRIDPDLVILTEGERWPEHIHQATRRHVPVIAINARMSDRSFHRMLRFPFIHRAVLGGITRLLPCSREDEQRFAALGYPADRITSTGNIKMDLKISLLSDADRGCLRRELGLGAGLVLLGSSTWPGEEKALLKVMLAAREQGVDCSLLIVPRHAERRSEIERLIRSEASIHLRSKGPAAAQVDVALADTTGELRKLTQVADVVFVGKSLAPNEGGQTPVEAAALQKPIIFGPRMSNFRSIAVELCERGAAVEVEDVEGLKREVLDLFGNPEKRLAMALAATRWQRENAGAVDRTLGVIREELAKLL
jgi:3-deoxy-D-manno-octulosonic-acid transferase